MDYIELSQIKLNPKNPRIIKDDKFNKLVNSISSFPEMLVKRPLVCITDKVDGKIYPLGGNMRLKVLQHLGYKEIPSNWVQMADDWTIEQQNEFVIKDNVSFGEWDWGSLANDWNTESLGDWGLDVPNWSNGLDVNNMTDEDVDLEEEFDPIGSATDLHKVIFIFDNEIEAGEYFNERIKDLNYKKFGGGQGKQWQVNLSTTYGK